MSTLNEHTSVLAAILSDTSDHSDTYFTYIVSKQMSTTDKKAWQKEHFKTNETPKKIIMQSHFVYKHTSHVTKAAGIKVFIQKNKKLEGFRKKKSFSKGLFRKIRINPRALLN